MSAERPYAQMFKDVSEDYFEDPISSAVDAYETSSQTFDDRVQLALKVQSTVSQRLRFSSVKSRPDLPLTAEQIKQDQTTNCYGNTIVTSELLEQLGVPHFVGFVNQHSFVWLYDHPSGESLLLDSHPVLRQVTTSAIEGQPPKEWQLDAGPLFIDIRLHPHALLSQITDPKKREKAAEQPWLGFNETVEQNFRDQNTSDNYSLPMRLYPSLPGREVLELYYNSIVQTNLKNTPALAEAMQDLYSTYPDVDLDNQLSLAQKAIKVLYQDGDTRHAIQAAHSVQASLDPRDHSDNLFITADTLRELGEQHQDLQLLYAALKTYKLARYGGKLRLDKITTTSQAIANLLRQSYHS